MSQLDPEANCKDDLEREFYIRMTRKFGWTKNVLIHQIENQTYEKTLLNQTNFDQALTKGLRFLKVINLHRSLFPHSLCLIV